MHEFLTPEAVQTFALAQRAQGRRIVLVPTMGYLHEGHLSLVEAAKKLGDCVIVSIFVNPTQFGPNEDFAAYPRDTPRDLELCKAAGVTAVFLPTPETMYCPDASVMIHEDKLSQRLCGAKRPGHFDGVCTVVAKLFNLAQPHVAVFGEKDFQQAAVIKRMVSDLNFPIEIVVSPTLREADGLAKSSRNVYLTPDERQNALGLSKSIALAQQLALGGVTSAPAIRAAMEELLTAHHLRPDYIELVDSDTLEAQNETTRNTRLILAAYCGKTRLIDNGSLYL